MDRSRRLYWGQYARDIADQIELRDWTVNIVNEPPGHPEWGASAECRYGRKIVNIRFGHDFEDFRPESQRATITHELIHCHFSAFRQCMTDARENVGKTWVQLLDAVTLNQLEYGIDATADALAKHLPLPPTEKPKKKRKKKAEATP